MMFVLQRAKYRAKAKDWERVEEFETFDAAEDYLMNMNPGEKQSFDWRIQESLKESGK